MANKISISPGYLAAVGTQLLRGRSFTAADSATAEPVALIDQSLASRYFAGEEPIGQRVEYYRKMWRIVGVVESIKQRDVTAADQPALYFPTLQLDGFASFNRMAGGFAVRTTGDPLDLVPFVRSVVKETDPAVPVHAAARLEDRLSETFAAPRFYSLALGLFALLALAVSILGVYGVLSYSVERRQVEFGVRRALGGDERHIVWLILRQASAFMAIGLTLGIIAAGLGAGLLRSLLFGVEPVDPLTFAAAALVVWVVGLTAAAVPAWRAMRIDPARILRAD